MLITEHEVHTAIQMVLPNKAPGEDQIPNRILKVAQKSLVPILTIVFNSSLDMQYYPNTFKRSIIVALQKPEKSDYTEPKSYRLVALMNTLGKIMDIVLAKQIQHITEIYKLLLHIHIGRRKNLLYKHAIYLLTEKVYKA